MAKNTWSIAGEYVDIFKEAISGVPNVLGVRVARSRHTRPG